MKKIITITTLALAIGLFSTVAFAYGPGWGGCPAWNNTTAVSSENQEKFLNETTELRKQIAADQVELQTLMGAAEPDTARIRELTESIFDARTALQAKAQEYGVNTGGYMHDDDYGHMHRGYGHMWGY